MIYNYIYDDAICIIIWFAHTKLMGYKRINRHIAYAYMCTIHLTNIMSKLQFAYVLYIYVYVYGTMFMLSQVRSYSRKNCLSCRYAMQMRHILRASCVFRIRTYTFLILLFPITKCEHASVWWWNTMRNRAIYIIIIQCLLYVCRSLFRLNRNTYIWIDYNKRRQRSW